MGQHNSLEMRALREGVPLGDLILKALNSNATQNQAAQSLGVSWSTMYKYIRELGVESTTTYYIPEQSEQGVA